ncbi:testis-expressed protein 47 isoform X2 [Pogoniulus pusillus]|uniref:testis-expressed protein 47 isoform X2 n=1 Tax=Pogoniulus pusillus TaxID=488313 RepID=UPI0030B933E6
MSEQAPGPSRPSMPEPAALERQSLLAVRQERLRPNRLPLHRLLVVARLAQGVSAATVADYYRELFENILEDHSGENISVLQQHHPSHHPGFSLSPESRPQDDTEEDMDESVHTLAPDLLIPPETVDYLCHAEECSSPEDFLRIYLSPSQVALDSETVWPVPSHLSA